jgi:hypothetical protein
VVGVDAFSAPRHARPAAATSPPGGFCQARAFARGPGRPYKTTEALPKGFTLRLPKAMRDHAHPLSDFRTPTLSVEC